LEKITSKRASKIAQFTNYYYGDKIKENGIVGACRTHEEGKKHRNV
jgi:hypothetical protein